MSIVSRTIGLVIATVMLAFSTHIYLKTGDWVAVVFALGSLGYMIFFLSTLKGNG